MFEGRKVKAYVFCGYQSSAVSDQRFYLDS